MATRPGTTKKPQPTARGRQTPHKRSFPLVPVLIGTVILLALLGGAWYMFNRVDRVPAAAVAPGGPVPTMPSRQHVEGRVEYSTNPPTSGDHAGTTATWGIYPKAPSDERLVHNLEHGGVIISYNPAKVDDATIEKLKNLTRDLRRERVCLVLTPRDSIQDDKPIALTAWGALALLDTYDEAAIRAFWRDHVARGPEFGAGNCG